MSTLHPRLPWLRAALLATTLGAAAIAPAAQAADDQFSCSDIADFRETLDAFYWLLAGKVGEFGDGSTGKDARELVTVVHQAAAVERSSGILAAAEAMSEAFDERSEKHFMAATKQAHAAFGELAKKRGCSGNSASAPASRGDPAGSYRASCVETRWNKDRFYAKCRKRDGRTLAWSYLKPTICRSGSIENQNGALVCDGYSPKTPKGSFARTCRNTSMDGYDLSATCQRRDGSWRETVLADTWKCGEVMNDDGRLRCDDSVAAQDH